MLISPMPLMPAPYSVDLRLKAVAAVDRGEPKSHVARVFHISRNTLDLWLRRRNADGFGGTRSGCGARLQPKIADLEAFRTFAKQHGHLTQAEMAEQWPEPISADTIGAALKKIGFTRKKTFGYRERDEAARAAFLEAFQGYAPADVVYVDEAGLDDTEAYAYGWCDRSERFYDLKQGHRTERVSMVAGWCSRAILAPMTFKGYCNTALIEGWVEHCLVPELTPGQVVILDNASFHKSDTIRDLIEQAGCHVMFLPPTRLT